jgi:PilZ domain
VLAYPPRTVVYSQLMSRDGELRRHTRAERSSPVQIIWKDRAGVDKYISGRSLDVSPSGMRVEISEAIEKQTYVTLQCVALALHGTASVRTCTRKGTKYVVGLEFSGGLQWKPKDPKPQ